MKDIDKFYIIEKEIKKFRGLQKFTSKNRKRENVQLRQEAMYFTKLFTAFSLSKIGGLIGNKNHATVLYSANVVRNIISVDKEYKDEMDYMESMIRYKLDNPNEMKQNTKTSAIDFIFDTFETGNKMEVHIIKNNLTYILYL